ncbi:hypothetical protein GCM10010124_12760 [Pilimelia terevasa]|uniref:Uncharacterized protein n=1 Tax=Pilimelia terevasa TaxID=53372 RepID=A0A8J3FHL5_9ACTN|nr:hypothetical protein [Pilimelia terevasa]GGK21722.1 hypothetical protein GCM10010124_12760 [Pilimelia terevasa]
MTATLARGLAAAALAAAAAVAPAAGAHAGPRPLDPLGTFDFGKAAEAGANGRTANFWRTYEVRSGFTGDDLLVAPRPYQPRTNWVYLTTLDFGDRCETIGATGVGNGVWGEYRCVGFAGDSLSVR